MPNFKTITRDELKQKIDNEEDFVLVDTLGQMSYEKAHLPTAVMVDAHGDDFVQEVEEEVPDKTKEVIVYCASFECPLSTKAAGKLSETGYSNVVDFEGGLEDWAKGGYDFEGADAENMKETLSKK